MTFHLLILSLFTSFKKYIIKQIQRTCYSYRSCFILFSFRNFLFPFIISIYNILWPLNSVRNRKRALLHSCCTKSIKRYLSCKRQEDKLRESSVILPTALLHNFLLLFSIVLLTLIFTSVIFFYFENSKETVRKIPGLSIAILSRLYNFEPIYPIYFQPFSYICNCSN